MCNYNNTTTFGLPFIKAVYRFLKIKYRENKMQFNPDLIISDVNDELKDFLVSEVMVIETDGGHPKKTIDNQLKDYAKSGYWIYSGNTLEVTQLFKDTIFQYAINGWLELNSNGTKYNQ